MLGKYINKIMSAGKKVIAENKPTGIPPGSTYEGELMYEDDSTYEGQLIDGIPNGKGRMTYGRGGFFHSGSYVNGLRHGKGKIIDGSGKILYDGEFKNDEKIDGKGKTTHGNEIPVRRTGTYGMKPEMMAELDKVYGMGSGGSKCKRRQSKRRQSKRRQSKRRQSKRRQSKRRQSKRH